MLETTTNSKLAVLTSLCTKSAANNNLFFKVLLFVGVVPSPWPCFQTAYDCCTLLQLSNISNTPSTSLNVVSVSFLAMETHQTKVLQVILQRLTSWFWISALWESLEAWLWEFSTSLSPSKRTSSTSFTSILGVVSTPVIVINKQPFFSSTCIYHLATFHQFIYPTPKTPPPAKVVSRFFRFWERGVHNQIIAHSAHKNRHEVSDLERRGVYRFTEDGDVFLLPPKDGVVESHDQCLCFFFNAHVAFVIFMKRAFSKSRDVSVSCFFSGILSFVNYETQIYSIGNPGLLYWTSWWFQPIWKIFVKLDHFPK